MKDLMNERRIDWGR